MIEAVIERCAGIDVGKKFLVVCVMTGPLQSEPKTEIRKSGTIVAELELLRDWLIDEGCSHAWKASPSISRPAPNSSSDDGSGVVIVSPVSVVVSSLGPPPGPGLSTDVTIPVLLILITLVTCNRGSEKNARSKAATTGQGSA